MTPGEAGSSRRDLAIVLWGLVLAAGPSASVGVALKVLTHHRPLGGLTFAIVAVALGLLAILLAARARESRHGRVLLLLGCAASILWVVELAV